MSRRDALSERAKGNAAKAKAAAERAEAASMKLYGELREQRPSVDIASRAYERFTEANQGRAFYTGLQGLADMVFRDHANTRRSA